MSALSFDRSRRSLTRSPSDTAKSLRRLTEQSDEKGRPPVKPKKRIKLLFLASDPSDAARLRLAQEQRDVRETLRLGTSRKVEIHERVAVRARDISAAMHEIQPDIVHFSGHGDTDGNICVEDASGNSRPVAPDALGGLFAQFPRTQCVVLNACFSAVQSQAIAENVDIVIGMRSSIGDAAAIAFSIGFYKAIAAGRGFFDAYKLGLVEMRLEGIAQHGVPELLVTRQSTSTNDAILEGSSRLKLLLQLLLRALPGGWRYIGWREVDDTSMETVQYGEDRTRYFHVVFESEGIVSRAKLERIASMVENSQDIARTLVLAVPSKYNLPEKSFSNRYVRYLQVSGPDDLVNLRTAIDDLST
ncbi:CHAT domain-containing protein [Nakamurella sp.]|uniref:CHAT domain-containing protein n=1 Tax=Nakamurella sp. TaxID=1869182 RepID=UPI003B3A28D8